MVFVHSFEITSWMRKCWFRDRQVTENCCLDESENAMEVKTLGRVNKSNQKDHFVYNREDVLNKNFVNTFINRNSKINKIVQKADVFCEQNFILYDLMNCTQFDIVQTLPLLPINCINFSIMKSCIVSKIVYIRLRLARKRKWGIDSTFHAKTMKDQSS